jgi:photosystem II stability/assembly factor-like uncharacterized protein
MNMYDDSPTVAPALSASASALAVAALAALACSDPMRPPPDQDDDPPPTVTGWATLEASPVATGRFDDVVFISPDTGWIASVSGTLHRTTDGGATWTLMDNTPGRAYRALGFASARVGWAGSLGNFSNPVPGETLFETRDGGATWTNISNRITGGDVAGICGMWVVDAETAYAVGRWHGPAFFLRTTDGGATWTAEDLRPLVTGLIDVYFRDRLRGIVVGGRGVGGAAAEQASSRTVILATDDGGVTWHERYVSGATGKWAWKISFPTDALGYVATQGPTADGVVLKTRDGGLTWEEVVVRDGLGFSGIGFVDPALGWAAAGDSIYETSDGGVSWRATSWGTFVNRIRVIESDLAYAVGQRVYRFTGIRKD